MEIIITRTEGGHIVAAYTFQEFTRRTGLTADQYKFMNEHGYCHNSETGREILMEDVCKKLDYSDWAFREELLGAEEA